MSVISPTTPGTDDRARLGRAEVDRSRTARRAAVIATLAVLAWAIVELAGLVVRHTAGAQLYGVLVAALAVGAAILNLALLLSSRRRAWTLVGAVVLWAVVALGGVAGAVAHAAWPETGPYGDPRPKPVVAPLAFLAMGAVGGLTIVLERRAGASRRRAYGEE